MTRSTPFTRAPIEPVIQRYRRLAALTPDEIAVLQGLEGPLEDVRRGADLQVEGKPLAPRFLCTGWAYRFRILGDGRRIITGFVLPGDGIGICHRAHPLALTNMVALTDCRVMHASPVFDLGANLSAWTNLQAAIHVAQSFDEAWLLDQVLRLGRQTAFERLGHLLLELHWRLLQVGLTEGWRFTVPLTQEVLADATGLSVVHVNRTIQQLRRDNLVEWRHQSVTILEPERLAELAEFRAPRPSDWR